jgi:RimJ/RimL family protein N-acetyltransferase
VAGNIFNQEIYMSISESLFEAEHVCLAPIDHEKDAEVEARWWNDSEYLCLLNQDRVRPLSPAQLKKKYGVIEKEADEGKNLFYFTIRMRLDDRLIGFAKLYWIEWSNGAGLIQLGIGDPADRNHGYGSETLRMLLRYAFAELNLYHLTAFIPEYNQVALHIFSKARFIEEVRRRHALNRCGRYWDLLHFGILRQEWEANPM